MRVMFAGDALIGMAQRLGDHRKGNARHGERRTISVAEDMEARRLDSCTFAGLSHWADLVR